MNIIYLSLKDGTPPSGYWDMAFLVDLLLSIPLDETTRTIVIIPGAYQGDIIPQINANLKQYEKVLVFITSDEEGKFDCEKLEHPDMIHYRQYGYCENLFPIGYTSETRKYLKQTGVVKKDIHTFFAGQLNSPERKAMFSRLALEEKAVLFGTDGFSRGLKSHEYYDYLAHTVYAPSPPGHVSPDSFRFYEALEAGCIPTRFSTWMFELFPQFPLNATSLTTFAWWIKEKMLLRQKIKEDVGVQEAMTIIVPTSPIKSHPSTEIIDQTIASIRYHTSMDIILTIDGVRPEQEHLRKSYEEYVRKLLWKCNYEYENVMPLLFDKHVHQSGMMKEALKYVKTPLTMYVEHDTPLTTDRPIDWGFISQTILNGTAETIRLHYEDFIPEPHIELMMPRFDQPKLMATKQWSQRPHITRTVFYKHVMGYFTDNSNCFLEDLLYGRCIQGDWNFWKLFIYNPENNGKGLKRSLNLDGRAGDRKFEMEQIW